MQISTDKGAHCTTHVVLRYVALWCQLNGLRRLQSSFPGHLTRRSVNRTIILAVTATSLYDVIHITVCVQKNIRSRTYVFYHNAVIFIPMMMMSG